MTILAKILSSFGLFMLYGLISGLILAGSKPGPSMINMVLSFGLIGGIIAIWRSKPPKDQDKHKLDKTPNDRI